MRYLRYIIFLVFTAVLAGSCGRRDNYHGSTVLARVGDRELKISDIVSLFPDDLSSEDSLRLQESLVDLWVRKQLKVREAENVFSENSTDIERMIEDYRSSLLSNRLDEYYLDRRLDTLFTDSDIKEYYDRHRSDFILDRHIVTGRIVRIPDSYRQKSRIRELVSGKGDSYDDLLETVRKNNFEFHDFPQWADFSDFSAKIPSGSLKDTQALLQQGKVTETSYEGFTYYIYTGQVLNPGDTAPLSRVSDIIKRVLYNQRRQDIIRGYEDSLLRVGQRDGVVEITNN